MNVVIYDGCGINEKLWRPQEEIYLRALSPPKYGNPMRCWK